MEQLHLELAPIWVAYTADKGLNYYAIVLARKINNKIKHLSGAVPACHIRVLLGVPDAQFPIQLPVSVPGKGSDDGPRNQAPVPPVGHSRGARGSWPRPLWSSEEGTSRWMIFFFFFPSLCLPCHSIK